MLKITARNILGINKNASEAEIKEAFRKAAFKYHPDRGGSSDDFINARNAFTTLIPRSSGKSIFVACAIKLTLEEAFFGCVKTINGHDINIPAGMRNSQFLSSVQWIEDQLTEYYITIPGNYFNNDPYLPEKYQSDLYLDYYVSPFDMILGGNINYQGIDKTTTQIYLTPGFKANYLIKVKEKGYWTSTNCISRGDAYLKIIPNIKTLDYIGLDEIKPFLDKLNEKYNSDKLVRS